jgi:MFS-type transporter involved in bile tolerance (Atg22 family)
MRFRTVVPIRTIFTSFNKFAQVSRIKIAGTFAIFCIMVAGAVFVVVLRLVTARVAFEIGKVQMYNLLIVSATYHSTIAICSAGSDSSGSIYSGTTTLLQRFSRNARVSHIC